MSASLSWMIVPDFLSFLPKMFIACPTSGTVMSVMSVSFQSRQNMRTMEPMRTEASVTNSMSFSTRAFCSACTSFVT